MNYYGPTYDPKSLGADCDNCPLRDNIVVPPENGANALEMMNGTAVAIIGEAPGEQEERQLRPFVGPSGNELDKALRSAGIRRRDIYVGNVLCCRPPGNRLRDLLTKINRLNKATEKGWKTKCKEADKNGEPKPTKPVLIKSPIDCCAPRLQKEIAPFQNFITLGKTATHAVTGATASIMAIRGGLMNLEATERTRAMKVMPTIHPAFCLRQPRWFHVFRNDVQKAGKWFRNEADWVEPVINYHPTPAQLREFLSHNDRVYAYDLETDSIECLTAKIRCLSVTDEVVPSPLSIVVVLETVTSPPREFSSTM